MKKYIILTICTAKDNNPNFAGEEQRWLHGKCGALLDAKSYAGSALYFVINNGFSTKAAASRALKSIKESDSFHNEFNYWEYESALQEVEIPDVYAK